MHPNFLAAEGWLELGNAAEAAEALHNLPASEKSTIRCLEMWATIYAKEKRWDDVQRYTDLIRHHAPQNRTGIMLGSEAFYRQGRSQDAVDLLTHLPKEFSKDAHYFYLLAVCLCANKQYSLALSVLGRAFDLDVSLRSKALVDSELDEVWLDIQEESAI